MFQLLLSVLLFAMLGVIFSGVGVGAARALTLDVAVFAVSLLLTVCCVLLQTLHAPHGSGEHSVL